MTVVIGDIIEVAARCEFRGVEDVVNVYQHRLLAGGPMPDSQAMLHLSTHLDAIYATLAPYQTNDFLYRDLTFRNVTTGLLMGTIPWPTTTAGSGGLPNNAPGIAGVLNMATNVARVVLRKYFGGFLSTLLDADGTFVAGVQAILIAIGNTLLGGYISGGDTWEYGHYSPKTLNFEVPTSATATDIPGYQRRRKQGRGV